MGISEGQRKDPPCHPFLVNALKGQGYGQVWVGQMVNSPGDPELLGQVFPWGLVPPGHSLGPAALLEFGRGSWYHSSDGVVDVQSPESSGRQSKPSWGRYSGTSEIQIQTHSFFCRFDVNPSNAL